MELFKTFKSKEAQDVTLEQVIDIVSHDEELKKSTQMYRDLMAQGHDEAALKVKEQTKTHGRFGRHGNLIILGKI